MGYAASVNGYKPHKGFGFVEFATENEATAALREAHNLKGAVIRVTSAKGEPAERKRRERKRSPTRSSNSNNNNSNSNNIKSSDNNQKNNKAEKAAEKDKPKKEEKKTEKPKKPAPTQIAGLPVKKPQKKIVIKPAPSVSPWSK